VYLYLLLSWFWLDFEWRQLVTDLSLKFASCRSGCGERYWTLQRCTQGLCTQHSTFYLRGEHFTSELSTPCLIWYSNFGKTLKERPKICKRILAKIYLPNLYSKQIFVDLRFAWKLSEASYTSIMYAERPLFGCSCSSGWKHNIVHFNFTCSACICLKTVITSQAICRWGSVATDRLFSVLEQC